MSWASREGWVDHFSIGARAESLFKSDAPLCDWDVSDLEPWSKCVGRLLQGAQVFSIGETPNAVELSFAKQIWWMADGSEQTVGDGDDLLIRSGGFPAIDGARPVWVV